MKEKRLAVGAIISVLLIVLLTPVRMVYEDGGSVSYKALAYEVIKLHELADDGEVKPYIEGLEIRILGMTVYRATN